LEALSPEPSFEQTPAMTANGQRASGQWTILFLLCRILVSGIQKSRSTFLLYATALLCTVVAVQSKAPVIFLAMFGLGAFLVTHLIGSLRKAYLNPVFCRLTRFARDLRLDLQREPLITRDDSSRRARPAVDATSELPSQTLKLYAVRAFAVIAADRVSRPMKRRISDLYLIASWLYTVAISIFVYAVEYYSLYRVNPDYFSGTNGAGFWQFAKLSIGLLTPASFSHIEPTSRIPLSLCYSEVAVGVVILIILVFSILTASREGFHEAIEKFTSELHDTASAVEALISKIHNMELVQVEQMLSTENGLVVNLIRKLGGLPQLTIPPK
jgi:hypothetical protein